MHPKNTHPNQWAHVPTCAHFRLDLGELKQDWSLLDKHLSWHDKRLQEKLRQK